MEDSTDKHHEKTRSNKRAAPKKLNDLLNFIDLVPQSVKLPQFSDFAEVFKETNKTIYDETDENLSLEFIVFCFKEIDKAVGEHYDLREYVFEFFDLSEDDSSFYNSPEYKTVHNYFHFVNVRDEVREIAIRAEHYKTGRTFTYLTDLSQSVTFGVENGKICFKTNSVFEAFSGVDVERVKICELCDKVFWASRIDASCCSKECAHNLRNRIYRGNKKKQDEYKFNRVKNDEAKAKGEKL